ncbi:hypothetical protein, partial [Shewanella sp. CG18_big_fil_WC_8_21_14_2_50_42_11]
LTSDILTKKLTRKQEVILLLINKLLEVRMVRALLFLFAFFPARYLMADEGYDFYKLDCNSELSYLHISFISKYNIGNIIWPHGGWKEHEDSLKRLEKEYGLHVFGWGYGRYSENGYSCKLGLVNIKLQGNKVVRTFGPNMDTVYYQSFPKIRITIKDKLIYEELPGVDLNGKTIDVSNRHISIRGCLDGKECKDKTFYFSEYNL